jgi:Sortase and related acyltransferases
MQIRLATLADIPAVLALHQRYHLSTISADDLTQGFVTTAFTTVQLQRLIEEEKGLVIACDGDAVVGYTMAASWDYWSQWPMFVHMIEGLPHLHYHGQSLTVENSYQYGPVCIDRAYRGTGLLANMFEYSRRQMAPRYPYLVTFINKKNPRSFAAHTRKIGLEVIAEFLFNDNQFYELAYRTSRPLQEDGAN